MDLLIRDFQASDKDAYLLFSELFYDSSAVQHSVPTVYFQRTFEACLSGNPYLRGFMLLQGDVRIGYGLISLTWANEAGGLCVWLEELYISPAFQGQGIGSMYIQFIEEQYAQTAGRFRLEATEENKSAIRLYKRLGYEDLDYVQMVKDTPPPDAL